MVVPALDRFQYLDALSIGNVRDERQHLPANSLPLVICPNRYGYFAAVEVVIARQHSRGDHRRSILGERHEAVCMVMVGMNQRLDLALADLLLSRQEPEVQIRARQMSKKVLHHDGVAFDGGPDTEAKSCSRPQTAIVRLSDQIICPFSELRGL